MLFPEVEVTRSLYNLYRQRNFGTMEKNKIRVIDSNEAVEQRLEELSRKLTKEAQKNGEGFVEGFVEGLNAEQVEAILEDKEEAQPDLSAAQEQVDQMLAEAKEEAQRILEEAQQQSKKQQEEACETGRQQGYQEGKQQAEEELMQARQQLEQERQRLEEEYEAQQAELEPQLVDTIVSVVEKVFHVQFDDKKDVLVYLIRKSLQKMDGCREFTVRVSEENYAFVEGPRQDILSRIGKEVTLCVTADALLKENECMIETDTGVFDCSLGIQLENLVKDIKCLSM